MKSTLAFLTIIASVSLTVWASFAEASETIEGSKSTFAGSLQVGSIVDSWDLISAACNHHHKPQEHHHHHHHHHGKQSAHHHHHHGHDHGHHHKHGHSHHHKHEAKHTHGHNHQHHHGHKHEHKHEAQHAHGHHHQHRHNHGHKHKHHHDSKNGQNHKHHGWHSSSHLGWGHKKSFTPGSWTDNMYEYPVQMADYSEQSDFSEKIFHGNDNLKMMDSIKTEGLPESGPGFRVIGSSGMVSGNAADDFIDDDSILYLDLDDSAKLAESLFI